YQNLAQLEEGYGIPVEPLETLAREVYGDDPVVRFKPKGKDGGQDALLLARMQKAAAIMQFKLEGQLIERYPHWGLGHRRLLGGINPEAGTIAIDGKTFGLADRRFPTLDRKEPYALTKDEQKCLDEIRAAFQTSEKLWRQMAWLLQCGSMYLVRDDHLIF